MADEILVMKDICKSYPGVKALDHVSFTLKKGQTHALMGENGAGKSTLIKVLSGAVVPDEGSITLDGKTYDAMTPAQAKALGVEVIYQEFNIMPTMSVAENIFMGERLGSKVFFNRDLIVKKCKAIFEQMGVQIDPMEIVNNLSVAETQLVEIARALSRNVRILVMDEPTAPLTDDEVDVLFEIIEKLKAKGVSIIYISHRLNEIFQIANHVTVMRDGQLIEDKPIEAYDRDSLIKAMVGREISNAYPKKHCAIGDEILRVENLCGNGDKDISFTLHKGEILGLAGLVGAGRTEIARVIFGADPKEGGKIFLDGKLYEPESPRKSIENGIGLIPEDRKKQGVILNLPIQWNITLPVLKRISTATVIRTRDEKKLVDQMIRDVTIKTPSPAVLAGNLSGGNQQKVVLAKWLAVQCKVLIFDEPTRGIDVGAKYEIYKLMNELCEQGIGIIMISSDMEEIIAMSDRMVVLCEGRQTGSLEKEEFTQENILAYASGSK